MSPDRMAKAVGRVTRGLRVASGRAHDRRFPQGTIAPQLPHFRAAITGFDGLFDGPLHLGTLNVAFPGKRILVGHPEYFVARVRWSRRASVENFYLSPCMLVVRGSQQRGLIYIPDPATKPRGLPVGHYAEILTSRVTRARYGMAVTLFYSHQAIRLIPQHRRRRPIF